jgi:hypothetical protein
MRAEILPELETLIEEVDLESPEGGCKVMAAVRDALSLLYAIDQGMLLAELPENTEAIARHETGLVLLNMVEEKLREAVGNSGDVISGSCRCTQHCAPD